jgi:hypothetical protein
MSERRTEELIDALAGEASPVEPLASPARRAFGTVAALLVAGAILAATAGDIEALARRYSGREALMLAEMAAMLATAVVATLGAFMLAVPGGSRRWMIALSGLGCYRNFMQVGTSGFETLHSADCLLFILGAGALVGAPLLWRLARARPIDPLPVALLGGLGAAALAALLLQFFHPFAVTFADLAIHLAAVLIVMSITTLARRRLLAPA